MRPCALYNSSLSIGRVDVHRNFCGAIKKITNRQALYQLRLPSFEYQSSMTHRMFQCYCLRT